MNPRDAFPVNLQALMQKTGITQSDIRVKLDVPASTVSDWVNGRSYPRVERMQQLADLFGVFMTGLQRDPAEVRENDDLMALREKLCRQPGMRILFDATKNATEQDLLDAAALLEGFKKRRDGEE